MMTNSTTDPEYGIERTGVWSDAELDRQEGPSPDREAEDEGLLTNDLAGTRRGGQGGMHVTVSFKAMHSSVSWEWRTPELFYKALNEEFSFNFDPCPLDGEVDGRAPLLSDWKGKRVFCNPPYGPESVKFLARASEAEIAVFLLPARTDTRWFHELCLPKATEIRFIRGRLRFGNAKSTAPFPSMVVIFGE